MPYDATIEIDEFRFMDTRDRPERDYRIRNPPLRRPEPPVRREERESQAEYYNRTQPGVFDSEGRRINPLVEAVNNPGVTVTPAEVKAINDPKKAMLPSGEIVKVQAPVTGSSSMKSQFPFQQPKRTRKKTKMDKTMSRCLKEANTRGKLKNGKFRKGWDQRRIMTFAHKLCKKA